MLHVSSMDNYKASGSQMKRQRKNQKNRMKETHDSWYDYLYIMNLFETNLLNSLRILYWFADMRK